MDQLPRSYELSAEIMEVLPLRPFALHPDRPHASRQDGLSIYLFAEIKWSLRRTHVLLDEIVRVLLPEHE